MVFSEWRRWNSVCRPQLDDDSESFVVRAADGIRLRAKWDRPAEPVSVVVFVHGFGEHLRRHERVAEALSQDGLAVLRYDLRGHGHSEGLWGDAEDYGSYLDDLDRMLAVARDEYPHLPVVLYGHSFGGALAANWAICRPRPEVSKLVLSASWFELYRQPRPLKSLVFRTAARWLPTCRIPTGVKAEQLTHDPESIAQFRRDPLVIRHITLRLAVMAVDAGREALHRADECKLPVLVLHGSDDRVTSPEGSRKFARRAPQAQLYLFEGLAHEMHREANWSEVLEIVRGWVLGDPLPATQDPTSTTAESLPE